ncbi:MAG: C39 family peptidase [Pseudomonadota bacterium]
MFALLAGAIIMYVAVNQIMVVEEQPAGVVRYEHPDRLAPIDERNVVVKPGNLVKYRGIVRQAYDYSCGSAALTTLLNGYLGRQFQERQIMEGLLRFGETDKIVERRGFSLLDMKRLVTALGHPSGGFRATTKDLVVLDHPAIAPIGYAGFKHFVVVKGFRDGRVYVADPALGNLSFTIDRFEQIWLDNVLFIVFPNGFEPKPTLDIVDADLRHIDDRTIRHLSYAMAEPYLPTREIQADRAASLVPVLIENAEGKLEIINAPLRTNFLH